MACCTMTNSPSWDAYSRFAGADILSEHRTQGQGHCSQQDTLLDRLILFPPLQTAYPTSDPVKYYPSAYN